MSTLKKYTVAGALFVAVAGTLAHFVYDWSGQNFIAGFFFPVSESTWEHMKLCFFPMLLYSAFMHYKIKDEYPCVTSSLLAGTLSGTLLIPVLFYTYSGILGKNFLPLDIAVFLISVLLAFLLVYRLTLSCRVASRTGLLAFLTLMMLLCFFFFTYCSL